MREPKQRRHQISNSCLVLLSLDSRQAAEGSQYLGEVVPGKARLVSLHAALCVSLSGFSLESPRLGKPRARATSSGTPFPGQLVVLTDAVWGRRLSGGYDKVKEREPGRVRTQLRS